MQFLRRFEKGEADIRLSNFYMLLKRINVTFEEFNAYVDLQTLDKEINLLEKRVDLLLTTRDELGFERLIRKYEYDKQAEKDSFSAHIQALLNIVYNKAFGK